MTGQKINLTILQRDHLVKISDALIAKVQIGLEDKSVKIVMKTQTVKQCTKGNLRYV